MQNLYPCDVYVQYSLRVDVLQVHGSKLQTAVNPPTPKPPEDFWTWAKSFWEAVLNWVNSPWIQLWAVFIILVVAAVVVLVASRWGAALLGRRRMVEFSITCVTEGRSWEPCSVWRRTTAQGNPVFWHLNLSCRGNEGWHVTALCV